MKRIGLFVLLIGLASVLLMACGGQPPEPVTFNVDMTEYAYSPEDLEVKVGQEVTIELVNLGQLQHELMIGQNVMMMDNRPNGYEIDLFESTGVEPEVHMAESEHEDEHEDEHEAEEHEMEHSGFMVALPKEGDKATITFTATEDMVGEWEIGCFEQEGVHYDAGMIGTLVVSR